jgi:two-component system phosphate regulon response regulator PhoB
MIRENDRSYDMTKSNDIEAMLAGALPFRYQDAHLEIDAANKTIHLDSRPLPLTRKEHELFLLLVENAGEVVPREVLLMRVWGYGSEIRTRTLDVHVRRLRKRLGSYSAPYIETIFGIGYRFQPFRASRRFQPGVPASAIALSA